MAPSAYRASTSNLSNSKHRLAQYQERVSGVSQSERDRTVPALAWRAYHLPGNSWCDDWVQYFANNHPLFGICCHHRLHPIQFRMRIVNFIGSIMFGLAVTNVIWLWYIYNEDETVVTITLGGEDEVQNVTTVIEALNNQTNATLVEGSDDIEITEGMVVLWTVGGGLHALFDNTVWYLTACVCCLPGQPLERLHRCKWCGSYLVVMAVVLCTAIATFVVVLRAALEDDEDIGDLNSGGIVDDEIDLEIQDKSAYRFLISYCVELALALFVYYPLIGTILFTGILGCGKVPILGGRPYEVMQEEKQLKREKSRPGSSSDHSRTSRSVSMSLP